MSVWWRSRLALITTIGVGVRAMISRVASTPSRSGMTMSIRTTSGRSSSVMRIAWRPDTASPITCMSGAALIAPESKARTVGLSSTPRTRACLLIRSA